MRPGGWTIALQLREVNSGVARREARQKLIEAARRREIDVVLVWRLDPWDRSVTATLEPWALGRVKFPSKPSIPFAFSQSFV
jgi:DNA invertase Pin-like site-specific DNA recombinase